MTYVLDGEQLQSYIEEVKDTYITIPGYEMYFYSRMDHGTEIKVDRAANPPQIDPRPLDSIVPTHKLSSSDDLSVVLDININNTLDEEIGGSNGRVQMIFPMGDDFFLSTLGDPDKDSTDFDYTPDKPTHKIGTMDTVIIKLKNTSHGTTDEDNIVFRGIISAVNRQITTAGNLITLDIMDHSEWLRQAVALRLSWFSTISLSVTGRELISNLIRYANVLYSGDEALFGEVVNDVHKITAAAGKAIADTTVAALNSGLLDQQKEIAQGAENKLPYGNAEVKAHKLEVAPHFYFDPTLGLATPGDNPIEKAVHAIENAIRDMANGQAPSLDRFSKEDQETIGVYGLAHTHNSSDLTISSDGTLDNVIKTDFNRAQRAGWIYSDLYIEPGLITFEHSKLWNIMQKVAGRSLREVYFDWTPKLSQDTDNRLADVLEIKNNPGLKDAHPNLCVLKYRLSPCMLPYTDAKATISQFYMWKILDDEVLSYDTKEDEQNVKTAVLSYGTTIDKESIRNFVEASLGGAEAKNGAVVSSLDGKHRLERRLGYRFLTDHDMKVTYPVIKYFLSNIILQKSQLSMFSANVTVLGNPKYQPGSIVKLDRFNADYYCHTVQHHWNINQGYVTSLGLGYGHKTGVLPLSYTDAVLGNNLTHDEQVCAADYELLKSYVKDKEMIGDLNTVCFIKALWQVATGQGKGDFAQYSKEVLGSKPLTSSKEWINLYNCDESTPLGFIPPISFDDPPPTNYSASGVPLRKPEIAPSALKVSKLRETIQIFTDSDAGGYGYIPRDYNITPNLILNIIRDESNFNVNAVSAEKNPGYGLMQLTHDSFFSNDFTRLNATQLVGIRKTIEKGVKYVSDCIKSHCGSKTNSRGSLFLEGLAMFNTGPNGDYKNSQYPVKVLGAAQVQAIRKDSQTPKDAIAQQAAKDILARYPYGPLGIQVHQIDPGIPRPNPKPVKSAQYDAVKKTLTTSLDTAMPPSVQYILKTMKKYASGKVRFDYDLTPEQISNDNINSQIPDQIGGSVYTVPNLCNDNMFNKTVSEWYTDNSYLIGKETNYANIISLVKQQYDECLNCNHNPQVDLTSVDLSGEQFRLPVNSNGAKITSGFGPRNISVGSKFHKGMDIVASDNAVYAARDGTVHYAGYDDSAGHFIQLLHSGGFMTRYLDLGELKVKTGDQVKNGALLGYVGPGPNETGVHLHFEIRHGADSATIGAAVDPAPLVTPRIS